MNPLKFEIVRYVVFFVCVFVLVYLNFERVSQFFVKQSLGSRDEIVRKLDLMFVKINHDQLTYALLGCSFGVGLIIFLLFLPDFIPGLFFGAFFTVLGWKVPPLIVDSLYESRCNKFVDQMVDGMTLMANGVRSGLSVTQTMERIVNGMPNPIRQEFRLVLSEIQLGRTIEEALTDLGERIPRADVQMFVTSVNILKETGGNMAETFQTIMTTIRERQKLEKKIRAITSQGITQGVIVFSVPYILLLMMYLTDSGAVKVLFTKPLGWVLLIVMLVLQSLGGIFIRKIVKIKV